MASFKVIKEPVHGTIQFTNIEDAWIKPFIDSENFQRLRQIQQLGLGSLIFPGGVHTRFLHGIGCCYIASQISNKIGLSDHDRQLVMLACLLHDIGHGPCSHAFEELFTREMIRHEDWTPKFLQEYSSREFIDAYNERNPEFPLSSGLLAKLSDLIMHREQTHKLLADVVSSQLDADRLDYLLRDSHFCGVEYGQYDLRWMLHCLTIVHADEGERLGITYRGVGVVEQYLMARRLMMRNVYHHKKKYAAETYLTCLLRLLSEKLDTDPAYQYIAETHLGRFLMAVNHFNHGDISKEDFIEQNFELYKHLCDYDLTSLIKKLALDGGDDDIHVLASRVYRRVLPKVYPLRNKDIDEVKAQLAKFKQENPGLNDWQMLLFQKPHQSYHADEPILVVGRHGEIRSIREESFLVDAMSDKYETANFLAVDISVADQDKIRHFVDSLYKP